MALEKITYATPAMSAKIISLNISFMCKSPITNR